MFFRKGLGLVLRLFEHLLRKPLVCVLFEVVRVSQSFQIGPLQAAAGADLSFAQIKQTFVEVSNALTLAQASEIRKS